jgi:4-hydroxybenzoate polyprenyltransferase
MNLRLRDLGELVRFSHTVFALPFALIAALAAAGGVPPLATVGWILLAMVGARTAAMAFNRIVDAGLDAANPRTASRPIPSGRVTPALAWWLVVAGSAGLVAAAWRLNALCLALSPLALAWVLGYSYAKRFTALSHLWLGVGLGIAPVGAWVAVRGTVDGAPLVLAAAVAAWVAGFDTLYSLQDEAFDRTAGLHSLPVRLGARGALAAARALHAAAFAGFAAFAALVAAGWGLWAGVAAAGALLAWQHTLVGPGRLERLDTAFFTANGVLSVGIFVLYLAEVLARQL